MTDMEAIRARHTVRKYLDKPIPDEIARELREELYRLNRQYGLRMTLITNDGQAFGGLWKLLAKGVRNYIALVGKDAPDTAEKLGYCGIQAALLAQRLGLNSWWVGGTYSKGRAAEAAGVASGEKITGMIAVGYGASQGTAHPSKRADEVSRYEGTAPDWFRRGVEAALLAPTALNKQDFTLVGRDGKVWLTAPGGAFAGTDRGIVKYHFEAGAGKENFTWAG